MAFSIASRMFAFTLTLAFLTLLLSTSIPGSSRLTVSQLLGRHEAQPLERQTAGQGDFLVGVGKADITGPVVELNMMGYADTNQTGTGLRQRLFCRSFIVGSTSDPDQRIAYLVLDTQSGDTAIRYGILQGLSQLGKDYDVYTRHNGSAIAVTGTHSHSGPGAWLNYLLPQITSLGFDKSSYQAIVDGCVLSMKRAHQSLQPGTISTGNAAVQNGNANRSPYAYLANPQSERARYQADTDQTMTALAFKTAAGKPLGLLSWYPVHGTSLYQNNTLITGDNKGVAAWLFESAMKADNPNFVAGFSQANVGDTTPNILGAYCEDTGLPCRFNDSTCAGKTQGCHGRGPLFQYLDQGTRSCYEMGKRQFQTAQSLFSSSSLQRIAPSTISSFHVFTDMSNFTFVSPTNPSRILKTCSAALGYGFAGGTTDGPGAFDFTQGANDTDGNNSPALKNPLWKVARAFIHQPSKEQQQCQSPKPILLDVGAAHQPYDWSPNIVDIQMMRVGPLIMIIAPGEATTMSGRRWREAIAKSASTVLGVQNPVVVIGGPANTYAHYIATEEEYGIQRYEGASTLYGPNQLNAYINLTTTYLPYLGTKDKVTQLTPLVLGPQPPINIDRSLSFISPVVQDNPPFFKKFGDVLTPPNTSQSYTAGQKVSAVFVGANPRNNFRLEGTFAAVEYLGSNNAWTQVRNDRDWYLVYSWKRVNTVLGTSEVTLEWEIEKGTPAGQYRFHYYGDSKSLSGSITPFEGTSPAFKVG